jgi:hypothetical protein
VAKERREKTAGNEMMKENSVWNPIPSLESLFALN